MSFGPYRLRVVFAGAVLGLMFQALPVAAEVAGERASAEIAVNERAQPVTQLTRATLLAPAGPHEVHLPYHWDREQGPRAGAAEFELHFDAPDRASEPWGVYFSRVGNRAELHINGQLLAQLGELGDHNGADYKKSPQYVPIPPGLLVAHNRLNVRIAADASRHAGLAAVHVGPATEAYRLYREDYTWRMAPSLAITFLSSLVGAGALLLWFTQAEPGSNGWMRRDPLYLCAAAAELFWAVRMGDVALEHPPLSWPLWSLAVTAAFAGWMCCMALFSMHVAGWQVRPAARRMRIALAVLFASSVACSWLASALGRPWIFTAWLGAANVGFAGYSLFYLGFALRRRQTAQLLVGVAGVVNVAVGVRDWVTVRVSGGYADSTWIRYSSVLFALALGYIVLSRFREARVQARDLMHTLQDRVTQRERELEASYGQLEILAREQGRTNERVKILKDLHDGVGAHISSAIRQLQSGRADGAAVLETLRDSLDQLKLSIDALGTPPGDVGALLANLRYRLEPRFAGSDLRLCWQVEPLEPIARLDAQAMRHLQYMLLGALSNVLQHAQAQNLIIQARQGPQGTLLRIVDDGRGFDAAQPRRGGLRAMQERAAAIGATLELTSRPGCTAVDVWVA
jgi:signal transduction histidine kinase